MAWLKDGSRLAEDLSSVAWSPPARYLRRTPAACMTQAFLTLRDFRSRLRQSQLSEPTLSTQTSSTMYPTIW